MKALVLSVCIISLAMSIAENLTSGTRLGKQIKFILSLLLISVIFSPLSDGMTLPEIPEIPDINKIQEYSQEAYSNKLADEISENISEALKNLLEQNGINIYFISTEVNISEQDSIFINKVTVSTDNFPLAERIIKENTGEETEIINAYN